MGGTLPFSAAGFYSFSESRGENEKEKDQEKEPARRPFRGRQNVLM
jgi:hypothetical protein